MYVVAASPSPMREQFAQLTSAPGTLTVVCPGPDGPNQSPGPWHRVATPEEPVGTLWCGVRGGQAVLAWTLDADAFVASIEAPDPAALPALYQWWANHS